MSPFPAAPASAGTKLINSRQPVYVILDMSEAPAGSGFHDKTRVRFQDLLRFLRQETKTDIPIYLSVILVSPTEAVQLAPLSPVQEPGWDGALDGLKTLPGVTDLGPAFSIVDRSMKRELFEPLMGFLGDHRPLVMLFAQGHCTLLNKPEADVVNNATLMIRLGSVEAESPASFRRKLPGTALVQDDNELAFGTVREVLEKAAKQPDHQTLMPYGEIVRHDPESALTFVVGAGATFPSGMHLVIRPGETISAPVVWPDSWQVLLEAELQPFLSCSRKGAQLTVTASASLPLQKTIRGNAIIMDEKNRQSIPLFCWGGREEHAVAKKPDPKSPALPSPRKGQGWKVAAGLAGLVFIGVLAVAGWYGVKLLLQDHPLTVTPGVLDYGTLLYSQSTDPVSKELQLTLSSTSRLEVVCVREFSVIGETNRFSLKPITLVVEPPQVVITVPFSSSGLKGESKSLKGVLRIQDTQDVVLASVPMKIRLEPAAP